MQVENGLPFLVKVSRPRFWLYLAGPYLLGYISVVPQLTDLFKPTFWIYFLYFLFPANCLLYGINDLSDEDTDQYNQKKTTHEHLLRNWERQKLRIAVLSCVVVTLLMIYAQTTILTTLPFLLFLCLAIGYSSPPFRFKARPLLDFSSNALYFLPGVLAYTQLTNSFPDFWLMTAFFCWTAAMHLFSAVPDISADTKAGVRTSAVAFGYTQSLVLCAILWSIFAVLCSARISLILLPFLLIYPLIPVIVIFRSLDLQKVYWKMPIVNTLYGFTAFWYIVLIRFYH